MGAEPSQNADFVLHREGKAVSFGNPSFPNVSRVLHLFDIQGRVTPVVQKKLQFLVNRLLKLIGKPLIIPDETAGKKQLHNGWFFKAFTAS
jgi:hypothetical protein